MKIQKTAKSLVAATLLTIFNSYASSDELLLAPIDSDLKTNAYTLPHPEQGSIRVYEFNQLSAKIGHAIVKSDPKGLTSFKGIVSDDMEQKGFSFLATKNAAFYINNHFGLDSDNFDPNKTSFMNGMPPVAINILLNKIDKNEKDICLVYTPEPQASTAEIMFPMSTLTPLKFDVTFPAIYDQFYHDYIKVHETIHCTGANEERAEYTTALLLLDKYSQTHPEEIRSFIKHQAQSRHFATLVKSTTLAQEWIEDEAPSNSIQLFSSFTDSDNTLDVTSRFQEYLNELYEDSLTKYPDERYNHDLTGSANLIALQDYNAAPENFTKDKIWDMVKNASYPNLTPSIEQERAARQRSFKGVLNIISEKALYTKFVSQLNSKTAPQEKAQALSSKMISKVAPKT